MRILLICFLFVITADVIANTVFKCKQGNSYIFSQTPCGDNVQKVVIDDPQSYSSTNSRQYSSTDKPGQSNPKSYILSQKKKQLQRKINALYKKKKKHLARYDKERIMLGEDNADIYYERSVYKKIKTEMERLDKQIAKEKRQLSTVEQQISQLN